jgi:hypothetical protein
LLIVLIEQGSVLLIIPGFASLTSGGLILLKKRGFLMNRVIISVVLYNLIIFVFQTYSGIRLIGSDFNYVATISVLVYSIGSIIFAMLLLKSYFGSNSFLFA